MTTEPQRHQRITRLAPSPTGALHLGNARTFLINWAMARRNHWRVVLRIEDLDGPRLKNDADRLAIDLLGWLGMDWDDGPTWQKADLSPYHAALQRLAEAGQIYPCTCTRKEIERAQSAPHGNEHELRYPGTCREKLSAVNYQPSADHAWRFVVPEESVSFADCFAGPQTINVQQQVGDFVVATKAGLPAYQLAVVVDDAASGVTDVVRGDDLLRSTARQMMLYRALGLGNAPRYHHLPLVLGPDGRRLAKRHGDSRIDTYRRAGVPAQRLIGLIAEWCGMGERRAMEAAEFAEQFNPAKLPHRPATLSEQDDAWLRDGRPRAG